MPGMQWKGDVLRVLLLLIVAHFLCDYPLQGDFLARGKNHKNPIPGVPWWQCMIAHAAIQGGAVGVITGSFLCGLAEFIMHFATDVTKSQGLISFNQDQLCHVVHKCCYALVIWGATVKL